MKKFFTLFLVVLTFIFCINTQAELIVKTIFFKPTDAQHIGLDGISNIVEGAQTLYADEMERQGFGRKTFKVERDVNRDMKVHTVNGRHQSWYYTNSTWDKVLPELPDRFNSNTPPWDKQDTVHIIIVAGVDSINGFWAQGWPHHSSRYGGNLLAAANSGHLNVNLIAHELGHCFGLYHKPEGSDPDPPSLEHYEARWLDKHYQFNNRGNDFTFPKLIGNPKLEAIGENEIKFTLSANGGSHGLHQCMVFRNSDILVVGWDYLNGKNMDTIEFRSPRWKWGSPITVELMDIRGSYTMKDFHVSIPDEIATNSDLVEGSHDTNTKEPSVNLTFNYGSSDSLVPINILQEWDGWEQGVWEKTPNGIVSMKPPDYIKTTNMDAWDHWIYSHAPSRIMYAISDRNYTRFESYFDLPNSFCGGSASVRITVLVNDNMEIYDSGVLDISNRNMKVSFTIPENTERLTLEVSDLGNKNCDHFVFGSPKLYYATQPRIQETAKQNITDVNSDGKTDILDLITVALDYGKSVNDKINLNSDINGDGVVNRDDILLILDAIDGDTHLAPSLLAEIESGEFFNQSKLLPNYPNPSNPETWIPYYLAKPADVKLNIYAVNGTLVRTLLLGYQLPSYYRDKNQAAYWDGCNNLGEPVANGIYFYQLQTNEISSLRKMVILK